MARWRAGRAVLDPSARSLSAAIFCNRNEVFLNARWSELSGQYSHSEKLELLTGLLVIMRETRQRRVRSGYTSCN
jgi:hypothetical protein